MKVAVGLNKFAAPHQIVEPIFLEHLKRDPERNLPVLTNVNKVAKRMKAKSFPKNPLNMEFDWGKRSSIKKLFIYLIIIILFRIRLLPSPYTRRFFPGRRGGEDGQVTWASFDFRLKKTTKAP